MKEDLFVESERAHPDITVGICTYRRASLEITIQSVADQADQLIIVDNDIDGSAREIVFAVQRRYGPRIRYIHAPDRNISIARNAALRGTTTRWLAFIDDDEVASHDWLKRLSAARENKTVVVGQSIALYLDGTPAWASLIDMHSNRISSSERIDNAHTSNVLIDVDFARKHNVYFLEECGKTGGEDTMFFRHISAVGGSFSYEPLSIVYEEVGSERATLTWLLRRKFRSGQTHAMLLSRYDLGKRRLLPITAGIKAIYCLALAAVSIFRPHRSISWTARATLHIGAFWHCLNRNILQEYGNVRQKTH